jgi:hypothetical protein
MPAIFDLLYREYCRARLAEMRKQLLLSVQSQEVPEADCDVSHPDGSAGRDCGFGDEGQAHSTKLATFTEPARLKAADGEVAGGIGAADVQQGPPAFRRAWLLGAGGELVSDCDPIWRAPGPQWCDVAGSL